MLWHLSHWSLRKHPLLPSSGVIEKRDSQPLLDILDVVGGWPVAMDKWSEMVGKYRQVCRLRGQAAQPHSCPQVACS